MKFKFKLKDNNFSDHSKYNIIKTSLFTMKLFMTRAGFDPSMHLKKFLKSLGIPLLLNMWYVNFVPLVLI